MKTEASAQNTCVSVANFMHRIPEYPSGHVGEGKLLPGVQLIDKIEIAICTASSHDQRTVIHAAHKPGWTKALLGAVPFCAYWQLNASARKLQQAITSFPSIST